MDKLSYLSAVQERLLSLPESDIRAALDYYMEQIDTRMQTGLSEEEAVAQLPDPQTAAEQILRSLEPAQPVPPPQSPRRKRRLGLLVLGLCLAAVGAAGLLLTRGLRPAQTYQEKQTEIDEAFTAVRLEVRDAEVTVTPAADGRCLIRWEDNGEGLFLFAVEDGCLRITQNEQGVSLLQRAPQLALQLPAGTYETLDLRSGSGSVQLSGQRAGQLSLRTTSGSVSCADCSAQKLSLESDSGSLRASGLEAEQLRSVSTSGSQTLRDLRADQVSLEASSGSVRLDGAQARVLSASCSSGSLQLDDCRATEQARLRCTSGSLRFEALDAGSVSAECTSGSIKGSVARRMNFEGSSSGTMELPESDPHGGLFRVKTGSGSIRITVD